MSLPGDVNLAGKLTANTVSSTNWIGLPAPSGAITLTTAAQPNVTSVGTLLGLTLSGPITPTYSGTSPTSSQIGYRTVTSQSTTAATQTLQNLQSIVITSGVWCVEGYTTQVFDSSGTILRVIISLSTTSATHDATRTVTLRKPSANQTNGLSLTSTFAVNSSTTVYLVALVSGANDCTSGSTYMHATRIA